MDLLQRCYESTSSSDEEEDKVADSGICKATRDDDNDDDNDVEQAPTSRKSGRSSVSKRPKIVQDVSDKTSKAALLMRSVPHIRGNWAGHVFLPIHFHAAAKRAIDKSIQQFQHLLQKSSCSNNNHKNSNRETSMILHEDLHISLSRTFYLQLGSIESFLQELRSRVAFEHEFGVWLNVGEQKQQQQQRHHGTVLVNDEQTRSFWTIPLQLPPSSVLLRLVDQVNQVLRKFQQPTYYDPPIFHVSLASCPGNITKEMIQHESSSTRSERQEEPDHVCGVFVKDTVDEDVSSSSDGDDDNDTPTLIRVHIQSIHCTFGTTKSYVIPLVRPA